MAILTTTMTGTSADDFALTFLSTPTASCAAVRDTYICTSDLGVYQVHFPILACASPVFTSLLTPRGSPTFYDIADDSTSFCCFLSLVYSRDLPSISTFSGLDYALTVSKKYDLVISSKLLRRLLSDPESAVYTNKDPWSAFLVAQRWGFTNEMNEAARQLIGQLDLTDEATLNRLQASESGVKIMSWLLTRRRRLVAFLVSNPLAQPSSCLVCPPCSDSTLNWVSIWVQNLYKVLSTTGDATEEFGLPSALEVVGCQECQKTIVKNARAVKAWMRGVREGLKADEVL
ncbi:hypothetical protein OPQ81_002170 [Rhizoctonia solani]|nr:hypothetical protein OPQ81_002170 [Rhizoctonia solani]